MAMTSLPLLQPSPSTRQALTELQALGARFIAEAGVGLSRKGGAGPSDHKAIVFDGHTVMVPIHTSASRASPYSLRASGPNRAVLERSGVRLGEVTFPEPPRFYAGSTSDGIPYWKIAQLHATDVLATTVLQTCIRYNDRKTACQFCAIGQSLEAERTVAKKTPAQLAEVAEAAVRLDGVKHMVMTTGTPPGKDRGAAILAESAAAVKEAVDLPIQVQCEPPDDDAWFARMKEAGVDALGMHLEAVTPVVRQRIMPGKAQVSITRYLAAFEAAVPVFGRGQVSTYILAGLGDSREAILAICETLVAIGVYPFVVPFVPISGTPLESHPSPSPGFMHDILAPLSRMLVASGLKATDIKAGCGKCGACSALSTYERGVLA